MRHRLQLTAVVLTLALLTGCGESVVGPSPLPEFQVLSRTTDSITISLRNVGEHTLAIAACEVRQEVQAAGEWQHLTWVGPESDQSHIDGIAPGALWTFRYGWHEVPDPARLVFKIGLSMGAGPVQDRLRPFASPAIAPESAD